MLTLQLTLDNGQVTVHANERQSHSFSLRDLDNTDLKNFVNDPKPYGGKLFQTLFKDGSEARKVFDELSKQSERTIVLVLESSELDSIAWEYAYHDNAYIVEDFAFIRALPEKERPHANGRLSKSVERVPLLFIPANPLVDLSGEPMRELDIESEWREMMQHIIKSNSPFDLIELRPATPAALQSVMARFQNGMIAHFSGHGAATKDGAFLLFENENGSSNPLEAREFVREVKDQAWIGFLSACQSAVAERTEYSNLARELVKAGVPFALGMQFNLPDLFAPNISGQFYNYVSQGHAVPEAARQARRAVKRENEFYVGMIALYAAHPNEAGKMDWSGSGAHTLPTFATANVSDLPTPSGFIGRQRELMNIGTSLLGKKKPNTVTLHGAGGIGKTALMHQVLLRFAPSFEATLAIALDPLPSLESVLGRLERFLNLPSPCSNDTQERERIVRERLMSKHTLLGLDNFETLNYALNNKGNDEEKTAKSLHSFFKYLAANGVTLCVTSREVTNLGGELIIDIEGLPNDDGGRLFQDNVVRQKDEIYIEKTQQVSKMVGGHPLALRLLASAFDDQIGVSLDQYIEDLQSHLPKARDKWTEQDRHESLRASFDFTMNNLAKTNEGKELQVALSRLSVFVAFFYVFTAMPVLENRFPENALRYRQMFPRADKVLHILWERGLLERIKIEIKEDIIFLYRLSPVLGIFAKSQLVDVETIKENYWKSMNKLIFDAEEQGSKSSRITQIALYAVPDLIGAAELKSNEDAALMQFRLSKVLHQFGLYEDALRLLEKSSNINKSQKNLDGVSATLLEMANVNAMRGKLDEATMLFKQSLEISEELGNEKRKASALHGLAYISRVRGNLNGAMNLYQKSNEIKKELNDSESPATLEAMGKIYRTQGDLDKAMRMYQQALVIDTKSGNAHGRAHILHAMADIYLTRGDLDKALRLFEEALEIVTNLSDPGGQFAILHGMADIYRMRGGLHEAMSLYQRSLEISEKIGDVRGMSNTLHSIANIHRESGNLDKAMKLYQQSLEIKEELGDSQGKASTLHEIAHIYLESGNLEEAMRLCEQSLKITEEIGDQQGKAATLNAMGNIWVVGGKLDTALLLYKQSLEIDERLGNLRGKATALNNIGLLLIENKQYLDALKSLLLALDTGVQIQAKSGIEDSISLLNQLKQVSGNSVFQKIWLEVTGYKDLPEWLEG